MTLKEKFENTIFNYIDSEWDRRDVSSDLEFDAEEFAIGFGEFCKNLTSTYKHIHRKYPDATIEELLKIYKKEKGL